MLVDMHTGCGASSTSSSGASASTKLCSPACMPSRGRDEEQASRGARMARQCMYAQHVHSREPSLLMDHMPQVLLRSTRMVHWQAASTTGRQAQHEISGKRKRRNTCRRQQTRGCATRSYASDRQGTGQQLDVSALAERRLESLLAGVGGAHTVPAGSHRIARHAMQAGEHAV